MDRGRFAATSSVVVDVCPRQHGVWLDAGELPDAVRYVEHRAQVGELGAQREADAEWSRMTGRDPVKLSMEAEEARIKAESAQRMWRAKRAGLVIGGGLVALRIVFWLWRASVARDEHAVGQAQEEEIAQAVGPTQAPPPRVAPPAAPPAARTVSSRR
jgi:Zn-finger nucleic acid-binding protein